MPNKFFRFLCVPANTRARQHTHKYTFPTYIILHKYTCEYMNMLMYINKVIQKTPVRVLLEKALQSWKINKRNLMQNSYGVKMKQRLKHRD